MMIDCTAVLNGQPIFSPYDLVIYRADITHVLMALIGHVVVVTKS